MPWNPFPEVKWQNGPLEDTSDESKCSKKLKKTKQGLDIQVDFYQSEKAKLLFYVVHKLSKAYYWSGKHEWLQRLIITYKLY